MLTHSLRPCLCLGLHSTYTHPTCVSYEYTCGLPNADDYHSKIYGGDPAVMNEFPWMGIVIVQNPKRCQVSFCGASLISEWWMLTAAHCLEGDPPVEGIIVSLSEHNLTDSGEPGEVTVGIRRYIQHPYFEPNNDVNPTSDWALLELKQSVKFSSILRPICLPSFGEYDFVGSDATIIGWGETPTEPYSDVLLKTKVEVRSIEHCGLYPKEWLDYDMICAQDANHPERSSCHGDSGGPLMVKDYYTGRFTVVGLGSWTLGCGLEHFPVVYSRINDKALEFIYTNTGIAAYCP